MSSSAPSTDLAKPEVPTDDREARFVEPKHRGLRALLAASVVVGLLGVGAARDGAKRAEQLKCWGTLRNTARGDAWQCEHQAERWLGIASVLPWTRGGAVATRADLRIRAAELELFVSTRGEPSRERRTVAATRLLERSSELAPAASAALQSGAYPELLAFASSRSDDLDPMSRDLALSAALLEVNVTALRSLLSVAPGPRVSDPARTAALACAVLSPAAARPWLDGVNGADDRLSTACGHIPHPRPGAPETPAEQRLGRLADQLSSLPATLPRERRAALALELIAPASTHPETTRLEPPRWYSPNDVLLALAVQVPREALDDAASQLDVILSGERRAVDDALTKARGVDPAGAHFPRETLERARFALRLYAFALGLRQGRQHFAQTQLDLASAHAPAGVELSLAAARLALREPRAALKLNQRHVERFGESTSLEEAAQRSIQRAYAENELGDRAAAYLAALSAKRLCDAAASASMRRAARYGAGDGASDDAGAQADGEVQPVAACRDVGWVLAATSIAARQNKQLPEPVDLNRFITGEIQVEESGLDLWHTLAVTPEAARRPLRVRLRRPTIGVRWQAFAYQLAGEVVPAGANADVWLDASAGQHRPGNLLAYFAARASSARWRGDAEAERAWLARIARVGALAVDDTKSYLLGRAGY